MRAFVAVLPPPDVVEALATFLEPRQDALAMHGRWRWTRPEHLHLTLAFLPELDGWREEELGEEGARWAARTAPLTLRLAGAGAFPDPGAARVLWAGVQEDPGAPGSREQEEREEPRLGRWAAATRALSSRVGARVDGTRFSPHVTVARGVGPPGPAGHLVQSLDTLRTETWTADEVVLVRSYLGQGPRGTPRYEVLQTWEVGAQER